MIHYARLSNLPADLQFPADLQERIWCYEVERKLAFKGFMSKATFDRLELLHEDYQYRRALQDLFRIAVPETHPPRSRRWGQLLFAAGLVLVLMAGAVGILRLLGS